MQWQHVPSHIGVWGNENADLLVYMGRRHSPLPKAYVMPSRSILVMLHSESQSDTEFDLEARPLWTETEGGRDPDTTLCSLRHEAIWQPLVCTPQVAHHNAPQPEEVTLPPSKCHCNKGGADGTLSRLSWILKYAHHHHAPPPPSNNGTHRHQHGDQGQSHTHPRDTPPPCQIASAHNFPLPHVVSYETAIQPQHSRITMLHIGAGVPTVVGGCRR